MKINKLAILGTALLALFSVPAYAIDTLVQVSTTGVGDGVTDGAAGGYDITGINEFDWQSSGDLVIEDVLPFAQVCGALICTTFSDWAANAVDGDTLVFDANLQARLNDMLDDTTSGPTGGGASVIDAQGITTLSTDGGSCAAGAGCFEITAATSIRETAVLTAGGTTLIFLTATGTYEFWLDDSPDSNVASGAGFVDGVMIASGSVDCGVACGTFIAGVGGSVFFTNTVGGYDSDYIQTEPTSNQPLSGATFDTLISLISSGEAAVGAGGVIGIRDADGNLYQVSAEDLGLKADANSEFSASPIPEPATLALVGLGLLGMAGMRRRLSS